jgi:hypothetical protein
MITTEKAGRMTVDVVHRAERILRVTTEGRRRTG